jgi:hypothetical protein
VALANSIDADSALAVGAASLHFPLGGSTPVAVELTPQRVRGEALRQIRLAGTAVAVSVGTAVVAVLLAALLEMVLVAHCCAAPAVEGD